MTTIAQAVITNLGWDSLQKCKDLVRLNMMFCIIYGLFDIPVKPYLNPSRPRLASQELSSCGTMSLILLRARQHWGPSRTCWLPTPSECHTFFLTVKPFYQLFLTSFIRGEWAPTTILREYASIEGGKLPITEDDDDDELHDEQIK